MKAKPADVAVLYAFAAYLSEGYSVNTRETYASVLRHFSAATPGPLLAVMGADIEAYIASLADRSNATRALRLAAIRCFYGFAVKAGLIQASPVDGLVLSLPRPPAREQANQSDIEEMLAAARARLEVAATPGRRLQALRIIAILEILCCTRIRLTDLLEADKKSFRQGHSLLGRKLSKRANAALVDFLFATAEDGDASSEALFPSQGRGGRFTRQRVAQIMRELSPKMVRAVDLRRAKGVDISTSV